MSPESICLCFDIPISIYLVDYFLTLTLLPFPIFWRPQCLFSGKKEKKRKETVDVTYFKTFELQLNSIF